jgi:aryl-alcohol dehydrogenase-like predicted oxidoreductase
LEEDGTIEALRALQAEGKVRFLGMSGTIPHLADHIAMGVFDVFQVPYSGIEPEHDDLITRAAAAGAGIIVRGAVNRGVNSDTAVSERLRDVEATMRERHIWNVESDERRSRLERARIDDLLGDQTDVTEFMLRFTLSRPDVHTAIVGTSSAKHLQANVDATKKGPLSPADYATAKSRLAFS